MNSKKNKSYFYSSRRSLIKNTGIGLCGFSTGSYLLPALFQGLFNSAHAQSAGMKKNYVYISQYGAPPRWYFDLPLTPDGNKDKFKSCTHVGTRYKENTNSGPDFGRYTEVVHETSFVNGLHMPWMWRFDIPTVGGGTAPLANLMEGMMIMRGINTHNPAHTAAQKLHFRPNSIPVSINALTADYGSSSIPSVTMSNRVFLFKSGKGLSAFEVEDSRNMIKTIIQPLLEKKLGNYQIDRNKVSSSLESVISSMNNFSDSKHPKNHIIKNSFEKALEMFSKDFGDLDEVFTLLVNKYQDLIDRSLEPSLELEGITDKAIGTTGDRYITVAGKKISIYRHGGEGSHLENEDLRSLIASHTYYRNIAGRFAVAEFLLINGLTSSISFDAGNLGSIATINGQNSHNLDEHGSGCMPSLLLNTRYNYAIAACLYEFISQLKKKNIFKDTVIDFSAEFGRNPKDDGTGSDHSPEANCNMFISGSIKGMGHVIGNIRAEAGGRLGTWGYGGHNPGFGLLNLGHFATTIHDLLGVPSQVTAVPSLVKYEDGFFVPKLPTGTIVD